MSAEPPAMDAAELRRSAEQRLLEEVAGDSGQDIDATRLLHELQVHQIELEMQNEELLQRRQEALAALQRYTELYDQAPVGYFTFGPDGGILQLNLAGAALLGLGRAELLGQGFAAYVDPEDRPVFGTFLAKLAASSGKAGCELRLVPADDSRHRRVVSIQAVPDAVGQSCNAVVSDITAVRDIEDERERYRLHLEGMLAASGRAKEAAERASRAKTEFLATIGHELRTPLTNLMVVAELLSGNLDGNLSAKQVEYARIMAEAGKDLLHYVDDLLDLAHIEAGSLSVRMQSVLFPDLLKGVQRTYREITRQKGLNFEVQIDADVPPGIVTDPVRLQQLLRNLLGSAIKSTLHGSVTLRVRRAVPGTRHDLPSLREAATVIAFDVVDTGIGIPPERQVRIFEAAAPGANATAFGLPLARRIARLLGGDLALASIPGKGSTFTVYLPLEPGQS